MAQITKNQKQYISSLAEDLTDEQFSEVVDATSYAQKQTFSKNRVSNKRSKTQMISGLNGSIASEIIDLLKSPEFIESIRLLDQSRKKPKKAPRGQRTISSKKESVSAKPSTAQGSVAKSSRAKRPSKRKVVEEYVPFTDADKQRLRLNDLQQWADDHNKNAVTVLTRQDINKQGGTATSL